MIKGRSPSRSERCVRKHAGHALLESSHRVMDISSLCSLLSRVKVLICRNYRGDVDMSEVEHFMPILMEKEEEGMLSPILAHGGVRFMWIKHNNLYLVATSKKNACVSLVFAFLYKVVQVFSEYFKELEEESIRDNFVIIYELLDELMDFGYPQTTDSKILQEYITQEGHKLETGAPRPPATVTNAVSWRSEGIKYRKNEVFLDVIESVNLLVSANGNVLRSEIVGSIKMRVFLSGMPELRLGLNDKVLFDNTGRGKSKSVELEDVKFHQCVRLSRFENDRTISFIPPDGEFELMSYRLNTHNSSISPHTPKEDVGQGERKMKKTTRSGSRCRRPNAQGGGSQRSYFSSRLLQRVQSWANGRLVT
ncbi:AP-1 complex subunit mu-1 isoform X3 [Phascolarctos cinereus]